MRATRSMIGILALILCQGCHASTVKGGENDAQQQDSGLGCANCTTGCCSNGQCLSGKSDQTCGTNGNVCLRCDPSEYCNEGSCEARSTACNSMNCADGCCTPQGDCQKPSNDEHCGIGGASCQTCDDAAPCANGVCGGGTCSKICASGCCDTSGTCIVPQPNVDKCGTGGEPCLACDSSTQMCQDGNCVNQPATCDPSTCPDSCCDKDGKCALQQNTTTCGKGGLACNTCNAATQVCLNGECKTQCNATTCPNSCCTAAGECVPSPSALQCGRGGKRCETCLGAQECTTSGSCQCPSPAACSSGDKGCAFSYARKVCEQDAGGCWVWSGQIDCADPVNEECKDGECVCIDKCSQLGQRDCVSKNAYRECGNFDADTCLEWSADKSCTAPNYYCWEATVTSEGCSCDACRPAGGFCKSTDINSMWECQLVDGCLKEVRVGSCPADKHCWTGGQCT